MNLGNSKLILSIFLFFLYSFSTLSEDKILSTPLINLKELKPSFEGVDQLLNEEIDSGKIKDKKKNSHKTNILNAQLIGLDKITAKTLDITINLGEVKKFGPLEIKILKCGKLNLENKKVSVAYLQVKDLTENENEKIFMAKRAFRK